MGQFKQAVKRSSTDQTPAYKIRQTGGTLSGVDLSEMIVLSTVSCDSFNKLIRSTDQRSACDLTVRENEVLTLVASGYTRAEIGNSLSISSTTAASHIASIYRKLDVSSIAEATHCAIRLGVVKLM